MGNSLIPQRVKNTGIEAIIGAALIGGAVLLIGYGNKKYNILGKFVRGVTGIGSAVGQSVGAGVASIPTGVVKGAASVLTGPSADNPTRASMGLEPDTETCIHIPFTNYVLSGNCDKASSTNNKPVDTSKQGSLTNTSPQDSGASTVQPIVIPTIKTLSSSVPVNTFRFSGPGGSATLTTTAGTNSPVGAGAFTFNNKSLAPTAVARVQPFQVGTLNTVAGGTRQIIGSAGLFARLQQNLSKTGATR